MERKLRNINRRAVHTWSLVLFKYHPNMIREARCFVDFTVWIIEPYWSCLDYRTALQWFSLSVETCTCTTMLASDCPHGIIQWLEKPGMQRVSSVSWHVCLFRLLITWPAQDVRIVCSVESWVRALNIEEFKGASRYSFADWPFVDDFRSRSELFYCHVSCFQTSNGLCNVRYQISIQSEALRCAYKDLVAREQQH